MLFINRDVYHVGDEIPSYTSVQDIQADGHELDLIRQQFSGIPMANKRVVKWTGEAARFIADNLDIRRMP